MKRILCVVVCLAVLLTASGCGLLSERLGLRSFAGDQKNQTGSISAPTVSQDLGTDWYCEELPSPEVQLGPASYGNVAATGTATSKYSLVKSETSNAQMPFQSADTYDLVSESGFATAQTSPLSTFAADVDTAAYANIRRMIRQQQTIPRDAVRIEEMINAFSYHYPAPTGEVPLAIATQVAACPWNSNALLLRVGLKAQNIDTAALPPANLVFLIDVSGSMNAPNKLPLVQRSFALLTEQLTARDRVSIVVYAGADAVVLSGAHGDEQARILSAISDLAAGGGTNGAAGLTTAYAEAARYASKGINSRVILATDGDFNVGQSSEAELTRLIERECDKGIFLTMMGFGYGNLKDNKIQALADHGNGNATYIDTIHQARTALVEEMGATLNTVAKDVKIQVEFNPAVVRAYRLIGYENRRLSAEDFADDTKDGGEMGAGHCVTALYELVLNANDFCETTSEPLAYQRSQSTGSTDYATVHVRYKQPQGEVSTEIVKPINKADFTDKPDADFQLAAAVAAFGQMLSCSEFVGSADQRMVLGLLQPLLGGDAGGRIVELYDLVRTSDGLYGEEAVR